MSDKSKFGEYFKGIVHRRIAIAMSDQAGFAPSLTVVVRMMLYVVDGHHTEYRSIHCVGFAVARCSV
jgi:hypothetical protein